MSEDVKIIQGGAGGLGGGKGGSVTFHSGHLELVALDVQNIVEKLRLGMKYSTPTNIASGAGTPPGDITFSIADKEVLRINSDGEFLLNEKPIGKDEDIFLFFHGFMGYFAAGLNAQRDDIAYRIATLENQLAVIRNWAMSFDEPARLEVRELLDAEILEEAL